MGRDNMRNVRDYIVKHCKIVFPVILIAVVAVTVSVALSANRKRMEESSAAGDGTAESGSGEQQMLTGVPLEDVPLVANEDSEIYSLVATYYNAVGLGDETTLREVCDEVDENEMIRRMETSKYLDHYEDLQVFTKVGPAEGSTVAYVYYKVFFKEHEVGFPGYETLYLCKDDQGVLYIKSEDNFTEEEAAYIREVTSQSDVAEFNNRVAVEYNELLEENPQLAMYLKELAKQVDVDIGVTLADKNVGDGNAGDNTSSQEGAGDGQEAGQGENPGTGQEGSQEALPADNGPKSATATTTVNVRVSDSELADKLGKVTSGTKLEVQEVLQNGWTKVVYEGKDGYIKSEYLQLAESAQGQEAIGSVTALENVNVRAAASQTAELLGLLSGGESLELLANEGEWVKVKFEGQVGYVKSEYVRQN